MLCTEDGAKTKLCRHKISAGFNGGSFNFDERCKASDCMAWRWYDSEEFHEERRGFCGAEPIRPKSSKARIKMKVKPHYGNICNI
uniref:Uncharacterized protein n=1 Tax=viral metagenome TaxID=1070528 RepID=A0A6M3JPP0_9ZZZZ